MSPFHGDEFDWDEWRLLPVGTPIQNGDEAWASSIKRWLRVADFFGLTSSAGEEDLGPLGLVVKANQVIFRRRLDAISMLGMIGVGQEHEHGAEADQEDTRGAESRAGSHPG